MAEFNLIKFDGKPLEKLLDVVGNFIGIANKPRQIRKEADAEAYAIKKLAEAKTQALEIEQKAEEDRLDRAQERIHYREIMKQMNIEAVTLNAAEVLKIESHVSDEPVDKDWTARFFNIVEDISNEQMQELWGRLLAGEVKRPKSFSLHTLEVLKNLSIKEAELYAKIPKLIINEDYLPFLFIGDKDEILEKYSFFYHERLMLTELGLLLPSTHVRKLFSMPIGKYCLYNSGNYIIKVTKKANNGKCVIPILMLSKVGEELLRLLPKENNDDYIKDFCLHMQQIGFSVEYALSDDGDENSINENLLWKEFNGNISC
jgi:hypothetical protein